MGELFVENNIVINATAQRVWEVLTQPQNTAKWANEFGMTGGIESTWELGSPVNWKDKDGIVKVAGKVTILEPFTKLSFTLRDINDHYDGYTDKDGIHFILTAENGNTNLSIRQGDFGAKPEYRQYYDATVTVWNKVLPKIKELAEAKV